MAYLEQKVGSAKKSKKQRLAISETLFIALYVA